LSAALGIAADLGFLQDNRLSLGPNHTVAGNPIRFRRGDIPIVPDVEWQERLEPGARRIVTALTWPLLLRYGFPLGSSDDSMGSTPRNPARTLRSRDSTGQAPRVEHAE
jgi:hypothetical protein